jgi:hypothetical protein
MNEKITDGARGMFEKATGKHVPDKVSSYQQRILPGMGWDLHRLAMRIVAISYRFIGFRFVPRLCASSMADLPPILVQQLIRICENSMYGNGTGRKFHCVKLHSTKIAAI